MQQWHNPKYDHFWGNTTIELKNIRITPDSNDI